MADKLLVVDAYGLSYRSFFAMQNDPLTNSEGLNVSVLNGFASMLASSLSFIKANSIIITLDSKTKTFRHEMFADYKANRPKTPEDLHRQIDLLVDILGKYKMPLLRQDGKEADDLIASTVNTFKGQAEIYILSADKDLLQLVNNKDKVFQLRPNLGSWQLYDEEMVVKKYNLPPSKLHLYLSILGDACDNIPGVNGIGEKGATKILQDYSSIDDIYNNLTNLTPKIKNAFASNKDNLEMSYKLVALDDRIEIKTTLKKAQISSFDIKKGTSAFQDNGVKVAALRLEGALKRGIQTPTESLFEIM